MTDYTKNVEYISQQLIEASIKHKVPMRTNTEKWPDALREAFQTDDITEFEIIVDNNGAKWLKLKQEAFNDMFSDCECCDNVRKRCIKCNILACRGCRSQCKKCNLYSCKECLVQCELCNNLTCPVCIQKCNAGRYVRDCEKLCCPKCMGGCRGWDDCCRYCQDF